MQACGDEPIGGYPRGDSYACEETTRQQARYAEMKKSISHQGVRHQNKLTLTLTTDLMEQVKDEAEKKAMPVATWIRVALIEYLENRVSDTTNATLA